MSLSMKLQYTGMPSVVLLCVDFIKKVYLDAEMKCNS
jgi:hypothetical protein